MKNIIILIVAAILTIILRQPTNDLAKTSRILPPPLNMKNYSFGFNEVLSDSLWLRFIQDCWSCMQDGRCKKSWGFQVLDEASKLDPQFKSIYINGATTVSVLLDDDDGAKILFDRGLEYFPSDWELNYRAGYHYLLELEKPERAAHLFEIASEGGAPYWTKSLAARLYDKVGQYEMSEKLLLDMKDQYIVDEWKQSIEDRLKELRKKKALLENQ